MEDKDSLDRLLQIKRATKLFTIRKIATSCKLGWSVCYYVLAGERKTGEARKRLEAYAEFMELDKILARSAEWDAKAKKLPTLRSVVDKKEGPPKEIS